MSLLFKVVLLVLGLGTLAAQASSSPTPVSQVSPTSVASPVHQSLSPGHAPSSQSSEPQNLPSLKPGDTEKLLYQFTKALASEMKGLAHRQKFELIELKVQQSSRLKIWKEEETARRREYFKTEKDSKKRRTFMIESKQKYDALVQSIKSELDSRKNEQQIRMDALKQDQSIRLKEFQDSLNKNMRPSASLWPKG